MIGEEALILGGNTSLSLGATNTPTLVASNSGGALATGTLSVICVALTLDGLINSTVASGVQASITRTNADSSIDTFGGGAAQKSANATVAITGPSGSVTASVATTRGSFGYAWYWGAVGSETLGAITTINSLAITANAAGTQAAASLPSADNSSNALVFDGLLTQALQPSSGANITFQPTGAAGVGTPLTADGAGGIVEIEAILKSNWDLYRLSPDEVWVSSQEAGNISKKILAGSANSAQRFIFDSQQDAIGGGVMVTTYKNKYSLAGAKSLDIKIHPNMPPGTMLFLTRKLPYPLANVGNVMQVRTRQDYYQIEWPLRARRYEYGVYADEVLQHYFPPSMSVITNIGNG